MKYKISVIGLGYVGLPLAVEFSKKFSVIGFDINQRRIEQLMKGYDQNEEISLSKLKSLKNLKFTYKTFDIKNCNIFIITTPTPVDVNNKPDLSSLKKASILVARVLKKNDIVIYESTVFPGATEEFCVPILQKYSKLLYNKDFYCGYSPERINPGDKKHKITSIKKITSGSNLKIAKKIDNLYRKIIKAGTYLAPSIQIAEAAKIIENTQRDVNIALINEFSIIFNRLNIDTNAVLKAASTKWNFVNFKPGLVGGHCIGVDPYYLAYKAKKIGINPEMIISGRKINDGMPSNIVKYVTKAMQSKKIDIRNSNILIMGLTFKENCNDVRNTKITVMINSFKKLGMNVDIYDPIADKEKALEYFNLSLIEKLSKNSYDVIVIAVAHKIFKSMKLKSFFNLCKKNHVIYDLKNILPNDPRITKL